MDNFNYQIKIIMMKTFFFCMALSLFVRTTYAQQFTQKWKMIWSDEFNKDGLPDSLKWNYDVGGHGWGNNELQYYTSNELKNARVQKGMLIIESHKEDFENKNYTSARLISKGKGDWKYGRVEVKAKLPQGRGTWPAIWMLASTTPLKWPDDGEIDIMEHVGFNQANIHASVHCKKYNHVIGTQKTDTIKVPDCSSAFHLYAMEWDAESISVFVDNKKYFTFKNDHTGYEAWPFDQPFYLLLNVAVGGNWGGQKGVDEDIWPQSLIIDYVRVYQQ